MECRTTLVTLNENIKHFECRIKTLEIRKEKFQDSLNKTMELKDFIRLATLSIVRKEHEVEINDIQNDIKEHLLDIKSIRDDINKYTIESLFNDDILTTLPNDIYILKKGCKLEFINKDLKLIAKGKIDRLFYNVSQQKVIAYNQFNGR